MPASNAPRLQPRNACSHPLTSAEITSGNLCTPMKTCIHCQAWFQIFLPILIIVILLLSCCCVKAMRPKHGNKSSFFANWFGSRGFDKPARIERNEFVGGGRRGGGGRYGSPPADRDVELGTMQLPQTPSPRGGGGGRVGGGQPAVVRGEREELWGREVGNVRGR